MALNVHPACQPERELLADCDVERTRRSGPGGQHRNRTESAVVITHRPSGISGQASERRSQHENRKVAIDRLRVNLAVAFPFQSSGAVSQLWQSRLNSGRISISRSHSDFPCLLAEAISQIRLADFQIAPAAEALNCSSSQLIRLLKMEDQAFSMVNRQRQQRNLGRLK